MHRSYLTDDQRDITEDPRFTGYIKNSAWRYEQESRLAITMRNIPQQEYYDLPLPLEVLQNIKITLGPWTFGGETTEQIKRIKNAVSDRSLRKIISNNIYESSFRTLINLKRHCDLCRYNFEG